MKCYNGVLRRQMCGVPKHVNALERKACAHSATFDLASQVTFHHN
jgi:hypothetical protein